MEFARRIRASMVDFAGGDPRSTLALWSPEIHWTAVGQSPLAGRYVGHEAVFGYLRELGRLSRGTFRSEVIEVRPMVGSTYVARFHNTAEVGNARLDVHASLIIESAAGQVTAVVEVQHDETAWDRFWIAAIEAERVGDGDVWASGAGAPSAPAGAPTAAAGAAGDVREDGSTTQPAGRGSVS